jgi:hypothetical protein
MKKPTLTLKAKNRHKFFSLSKLDYNALSGKLDLIKKEKGRMTEESLGVLFFFSQHKDVFVRQAVMEVVIDKLKKGHPIEKVKLYPLLLVGVGDKDCRYAAIEGLSYFPKANLIYLLGSVLLQDKNSLVRVQASDVLAFLNSRAAIPYLEHSLNDKDSLVRTYSAYGLALLGSKESIPGLVKLQKNDRRASVKTACWGGLLLLTRERVWLEKLFNVLNHSDYHIPMQAISYISNAVDEKIISKKDVMSQILDCLRKEKREAVSSRMKTFLGSSPK